MIPNRPRNPERGDSRVEIQAREENPAPRASIPSVWTGFIPPIIAKQDSS